MKPYDGNRSAPIIAQSDDQCLSPQLFLAAAFADRMAGLCARRGCFCGAVANTPGATSGAGRATGGRGIPAHRATAAAAGPSAAKPVAAAIAPGCVDPRQAAVRRPSANAAANRPVQPGAATAGSRQRAGFAGQLPRCSDAAAGPAPLASDASARAQQRLNAPLSRRTGHPQAVHVPARAETAWSAARRRSR